MANGSSHPDCDFNEILDPFAEIAVIFSALPAFFPIAKPASSTEFVVYVGWILLNETALVRNPHRQTVKAEMC